MVCHIAAISYEDYILMHEDQTVQEAVTMLIKSGVGWVIITNENYIHSFRLLNEQTLLHLMKDNKIIPSNIMLKNVMTLPCALVDHAQSCREALTLMEKNNCHYLVVYQSEVLIGILAENVLHQYMAQSRHFWADIIHVMGNVTFVLMMAIIVILILMFPMMTHIVLSVTRS